MVRMSILRLAASVAVVFSIVNAPTCEARPSPLEKLHGVDLTDLLDAPLDETFLQRKLQESTAPTPTPLDLSTVSPTLPSRELSSEMPTAAPTAAPTSGIRGMSSLAPTGAPTAPESSGAIGMVQIAASFATAATVLMATAVIA